MVASPKEFPGASRHDRQLPNLDGPPSGRLWPVVIAQSKMHFRNGDGALVSSVLLVAVLAITQFRGAKISARAQSPSSLPSGGRLDNTSGGTLLVTGVAAS